MTKIASGCPELPRNEVLVASGNWLSAAIQRSRVNKRPDRALVRAAILFSAGARLIGPSVAYTVKKARMLANARGFTRPNHLNPQNLAFGLPPDPESTGSEEMESFCLFPHLLYHLKYYTRSAIGDIIAPPQSNQPRFR
jgi:hypothetical protein